MMMCSSQVRLQLPFLPATPYYLPRPIASNFVDKKSNTSSKFGGKLKAMLHPEGSAREPDKERDNGGEEEFRVLTAIQSGYNHIVILDTPKSRLLLLDSTRRVCCIATYCSGGSLAIFGFGGGTAAHLMLDLWPSLQLEGWEIDEILIDKSRDYLWLCDLEKRNTDGGVLNNIGDAFSPSAAISGGYAGIIVDLFSDGKVLPQLEEVDTWLELYDKLMPNGLFMVNCGAGEDSSSIISHAVSQHDDSSIDETWKLNATIKALCKAFPGQVNWKRMPKSAGENYLALTGSLPDLANWSDSLPNELSSSVIQWGACNIGER